MSKPKLTEVKESCGFESSLPITEIIKIKARNSETVYTLSKFEYRFSDFLVRCQENRIPDENQDEVLTLSIDDFELGKCVEWMQWHGDNELPHTDPEYLKNRAKDPKIIFGGEDSWRYQFIDSLFPNGYERVLQQGSSFLMCKSIGEALCLYVSHIINTLDIEFVNKKLGLSIEPFVYEAPKNV